MKRPLAGVLLVTVVVVGTAILGALLLRGNEPPDDGFSLRRPALGEARADHLADGTPVWVIGHADGTVDVLSGFDPHTPSHLGKLLWWCPTARALDNPHHGSKWDEYGVKLGGPAPAGLASWETAVQGSRVFIGEVRPAPPIGTEPAGPPEIERVWCRSDDGVVVHTFDGWPVWDSVGEAIEAAPTGWILVEGRLVPQGGGIVRLCSPSDCTDGVDTGIEPPSPEVARLDPWLDPRFLARVRDGTLVDITRIVHLEAAP